MGDSHTSLDSIDSIVHGPESYSQYSHRRLREVFEMALAAGGIQGGGDVAAIPDNPDEVPDAPDAEVSGETIESNEIHEQAKGYLGNDEDAENEEDPEKAADARVAAKKAAKAKAEAAAESGEDDEEDAEALAAKKAASRVGRKSNEYKALEAKTAAYEKRFEQFENYVAQLQNQAQVQIAQIENQRRETEKALAVATKELEIIRSRAEQQEEAGLDDLEKFRRRILRETEGNVGKKYEGQLQEMRQLIEQERQARAEEARERALQSRIAGYDRDTDQAVAELLKGRPPEKVAALSQKTKTAVLNYAAAHNILPKQAALELRQWAHDFVLSGMKAKNVVNKEKAAAAKKIPSANPAGKTQAKGTPRPSHQQAKKKGYGSALEQMVNENPPPWAQN